MFVWICSEYVKYPKEEFVQIGSDVYNTKSSCRKDMKKAAESEKVKLTETEKEMSFFYDDKMPVRNSAEKKIEWVPVVRMYKAVKTAVKK